MRFNELMPHNCNPSLTITILTHVAANCGVCVLLRLFIKCHSNDMCYVINKRTLEQNPAATSYPSQCSALVTARVDFGQLEWSQ